MTMEDREKQDLRAGGHCRMTMVDRENRIR